MSSEEAEVEQEAETEEPEKEKPMKERPEKPKATTKRKEEKGIFSYYQIDEEGGLKRLRPFCERCGAGFFMADHGNRYTCGHCGFTRYKQNKESQ